MINIQWINLTNTKSQQNIKLSNNCRKFICILSHWQVSQMSNYDSIRSIIRSCSQFCHSCFLIIILLFFYFFDVRIVCLHTRSIPVCSHLLLSFALPSLNRMYRRREGIIPNWMRISNAAVKFNELKRHYNFISIEFAYFFFFFFVKHFACELNYYDELKSFAIRSSF